MSVFGKIPDVKKTVSSDFKKINSTILLIGKQDINVDLKVLPTVFESLHSAINKGKVLACHDISEGGLITSIFEMCVGGDVGAEIESNPESIFSETAGCFIVEVENKEAAKQLFEGIPYKILGTTTKMEKLIVKKLFKADIKSLQEVWSKPMKEMFG